MPKNKSTRKVAKKKMQKNGHTTQAASKKAKTGKTAKTSKIFEKSKVKLAYPKATKCCPHCIDQANCTEKGACCNYCDFYFKGHCMYEKEKNLINPSNPVVMEMDGHTGDDYGIDDYEAYEPLFE